MIRIECVTRLGTDGEGGVPVERHGRKVRDWTRFATFWRLVQHKSHKGNHVNQNMKPVHGKRDKTKSELSSTWLSIWLARYLA